MLPGGVGQGEQDITVHRKMPGRKLLSTGIQSLWRVFSKNTFNKVPRINKNNITSQFSFINLEMITKLLLRLIQESSLEKGDPSCLPVAHLSPASLASCQVLQCSQCLPLDLCTC